ncbi:ATP-binding protein [Mycobacterium sp.]|uniref:ATP-binding protein n=1 Tax=Mycobacterium sp. TaxID=1785 RepID=UPI003F9DE434
MSAAAAAAPSGVVTFLFTDVEGSTRRWEADADGMRIALAAHDEVLRGAIEAYDGFLFSHTGDGFVAAFASPMSAVNAAIDAQRELQLPVRMGLATGEAELRDGDYFGTVLNRAARVMAAGHGGQILLAESTAGLVSGVDLVDLGLRRLRDLPTPVQVFQVQAAGLRTEFPSLRALDVGPGNLRPAPTSFIGRESEVAEVEAVLRAHRVVTLTGVGGVGKTRLAVEVAARLADEFPDGVWFFELAAVSDPAAVPDAVAAVLGITQQPGKSVSESVAAALEGRARLLVFDNCEHVLGDAADLIEAIMAHSATVKMLATSREGLGVADEHLWPVPSLGVDTGIDSSALALFVERAQAVSPRFSVANTGEGDAVLEICRRLDGIPLAIELAASRMASMTVNEVRDRLDQRFRLLIGSRRGLARHQTLRHAVQWSYDHLDDAEKPLLERCSVFAGGFDLESACAVMGSDDDFATVDLLDALVRKSLLVADRSGGRTRFSMLETIRQFAEEMLTGRGDADKVRNAHARYFAEHESDVFALWDSPQQREAYSWITVEMANLRTAFRWAADHDDLDSASAIAHYAALVGFWGEQHEPIRWVEELIEPAHAVQHRRLAQLYAMATLCFTAGRIDEAVGYAGAGQEAVTSGRFDEVRKDIEAGIGSPYQAIGQPERWVEWCRIVIARRSATNVHAQALLAIALKMAGADDEARAASEELLAAADTTDNPNLAAWALFAYGTAHRGIAPAAAYEAFRRGLTIAQDSGSRMTETSIAGMLSLLATTHGEAVDALDYVILPIRYYYDSGSFFLLPQALGVLIPLFDRLGHHEAAATISGFAATSYTRLIVSEMDVAITHLRNVLGDETYESLAHKGETMTTAAMVTYAYDQIDQARTELKTASK